jgi:hypothetical protein
VPTSGQTLTFDNPFPDDARLGGQLGGQFVAWNFKQGYMQQWSLGLQRQLSANISTEVAYVGSKGTSLDAVRRLNQGALPGTANAAYYRPYPRFGTFTVADSTGDSNYHSLQTRLTRRFASGASFIAAYTYSHGIDNANGEGGGSGSSLFASDNTNLRKERGNSDFDVRHRFTLSAVYELPFGPGRRFLNSATGIAARLLEGWQAAVIYQAQTGFPFTVTQSGDRSLTSSPGERADRLCDGALSGSESRRERWFDTSCFAVSPLGRFGNGGRNTLRFPGQNNFDFSLIKQTPIADKARLEFRSEFFNLPNHTQFSLTGGMGSSVSSPATFGAISAAMDPRILQFSLRLLF